jgi:hypothetical protein
MAALGTGRKNMERMIKVILNMWEDCKDSHTGTCRKIKKRKNRVSS